MDFLSAATRIVDDLLIFIGAMVVLCAILLVIIARLPAGNPLKRILVALCYRMAATLGAGIVAIPIEPMRVWTRYMTPRRGHCHLLAFVFVAAARIPMLRRAPRRTGLHPDRRAASAVRRTVTNNPHLSAAAGSTAWQGCWIIIPLG